ncbi:hypothetical protein NYZ42_18350, partial [Acinetobacter baumannii]|nr:hypothetical protein [Acinetobacter baumannii]
LTKGEKRSEESEPVKEIQGGAISKGEPHNKGEQTVEEDVEKDFGAELKVNDGDGNLVEHEIGGENVLMSKDALKEMQGIQRPILPPVIIRE